MRTEFFRPAKGKQVWPGFCRARCGEAPHYWQCTFRPQFLSPMRMQEGMRSVADDRLRLCIKHWIDYDGWPAPESDLVHLKEFEPEPDIIIDALQADAEKAYWQAKLNQAAFIEDRGPKLEWPKWETYGD